MADFRGKLKPYDKDNKPRDREAEEKSTSRPRLGGLEWAHWLLALLLPLLALLIHRDLARV